jgi:hypothetical protein
VIYSVAGNRQSGNDEITGGLCLDSATVKHETEWGASRLPTFLNFRFLSINVVFLELFDYVKLIASLAFT